MTDQTKDLANLRKQAAAQAKLLNHLIKANQDLIATNQQLTKTNERLVQAFLDGEDLEDDDMAVKPRYLDD